MDIPGYIYFKKLVILFYTRFKYGLILLAIVLTSCGERKDDAGSEKRANQATHIDDYSWMLGTWLAHGLEFFEIWEKQDDSTYIGKAYKELGVDSTLSEIIRFEHRDGEFYYIPTVRKQNDGQPVVFKGVNAELELIQFENLNHDFPNRIVYFKRGDVHMDVKIESVTDGYVDKSYDIPMSKME